MSSIPKSLDITVAPNSEVRLKPERRKYASAYKQAILQECDACTYGEVGAILRREGLYSSILSKWRMQRASGALMGLEPQARGPHPEPQLGALAQLRHENERLQLRLKQAEAIIEVQKKVSQLLGLVAILPDDSK